MNISRIHSPLRSAAVMLMGITLAGCTTTRTATNEPDIGVDDHHDNVALEVTSSARPGDREQRRTTGRHQDAGDDARADEDHSTTSMAFPTGDRETSALLVQQVMPRSVHRGQDFDFRYHVTNLTDTTLRDVRVIMDDARNLEIVDSQPSEMTGGDQTQWLLGEMGPGQTEVIEVTGSAQELGTASDCISVSYNNFLCATVDVIEPSLALTKTVPEFAYECDDEIPLRYTVRNTGTGTAEDVTIRDTLPEGMSMSRGNREVNIPVGDLPAGESKAYEVRVRTTDTGEYSSRALATGDGGLEARADATETMIIAPDIDLAVDCNETQHLGEDYDYNFTFENNGQAPVREAIASATIPRGATVVDISDGGRVSGNAVVWNFGTIDAESSEDFSMTVNASEKGTYRTAVTADAFCARTVTRSCTTEVEGIPAILLEVVDTNDPVRIGGETTYVITVTNQGSAVDRDIRISATLPPEQSFVSASGATTARNEGQVVVFRPYDTLDVDEEIQWRVTVRANAESDSRFHVEMTSGQLTTPVFETEATNLHE